MAKKLEITKEMTDTVISMYLNEKPLEDIEKAIGHCDAIIYRILKDNNIALNRKKYIITDEQKNQMVQLHNDGLSYKEISNIVGFCSETKVYEILRDLGVLNSFSPIMIKSMIDSYNSSQGNRKYYFDEHIFDDINTPDKAYCLGLFMADGCNHYETSAFSIELQERDKGVLEGIKLMFQSDYPLYFRDKDKSNNLNQNTYNLRLHSKYFCQRLYDLGVIPRKSLELKFPKWMSDVLIPYLIKGYIDGDGWVQKNNISFMSTYDFCYGVQQYLSSINIKSVIVDQNEHYNENTKVLRITGRNNMIPLAEIMFSHGNLCIERKYQKYIEYGYLNNENINNSQSA